MSKKKNRPQGPNLSEPAPQARAVSFSWKTAWPVLLAGLVFFLFVCVLSTDVVKYAALIIVCAAILALLFGTTVLSRRFTWVAALLSLFVCMDGISTLYAVSGKFALSEFLKVLISFAFFLLILRLERGGNEELGRRTATVLESGAALLSIISIDLISTRVLASLFQAVMGLFGSPYDGLEGVEVGIRMTSVTANGNIFAGCAGIGVLISLGLATTAQAKNERRFHLACLAVNSLGFLLAFSMGASGMIALAFLAYLALERGERRASLLILMVETLVLTVAAAFPIYLTSFDAWSGVQPIPLGAAAAAAILLCLLDELVGRRIADKLAGRGRAVAGLAVGILAVIGVYAALALNVTGGTVLQSGETLRRADYPDPGSYVLQVQADGALNVTIESQNREETMMHTSTVLYTGAAQDAAFEVPEDSLVVYFNFRAAQDTSLEAASYQGDNGGGSLKLGYKLLPGFIANRLQGMFANENAIQRTVFFEDGLKLFRRSLVIGLGMGAFENSAPGVQSFHYETKYVHNHYIQVMVETGVIGFILFVGTLLLAAASVWKARKKGALSHPLTACLGAALVFMAGHAAVEVVFSSAFYLPFAFGVFALISLCCGVTMPCLSGRWKAQANLLRGMAALLAVYALLLVGNVYARTLLNQPTYENMSFAISLDKFEWADYMTSYAYSAYLGEDTPDAVMAQARGYAERLERVDSNTIPIYLAECYFKDGETEKAYQMLEKYVDYVASDSETWDNAFLLIVRYVNGSEAHSAGAARIYQLFQAWNEENMGSLTVNETLLAAVQALAE